MADSSIPKTMQAIQVTEFHKPYAVNTVPVPTDLGPYDLLVKVAVASYCHTDSMVRAGILAGELPVIASHEGAGTVVAVGPSVDNFSAGDRVMCGIPRSPCGTCADCEGPEHQRQYCAAVDGHAGINVDGFFAEFACADARTSTRLPDAVSLASAAPLACAGRTVWRGVLQADLAAGATLAVVGSGGGLGHLGIQFAKAKGLRVVGIDARDDGLALSRECGADVVVDARRGKEAAVKEVQAATGGAGADATLVLSDAETAAALGATVTRMHGTMVQIAQPNDVVIPFQEFIFRDIRVKGSVLCSPDEGRDMVDFIAEHGIEVKTRTFHGLDKIQELVELVESGKIRGKALIIVDQEQLDREQKSGA